MIKKAKLQQELELRFIASLVSLTPVQSCLLSFVPCRCTIHVNNMDHNDYLQIQQGKLPKSEVKACLRILLPHKTDAELEQLIAVLHTGNDEEDGVESGSEQDL